MNMKSVLLLSFALSAWAGDAQRGMMALENQACLDCHTVRGQGSGHEPNATAPELGTPAKQAFTPATLVSALWNHAPAMWNEASAKHAGRPDLRDADWADLFAYLYSVQVFDLPAQTRRGQDVLTAKRCDECHSLTKPGVGKPVSAWKTEEDPATLVYQMWNHSSTMGKVFAGRRVDWPKLEARDFQDLSAYVAYRQKRPPQSWLSLPDPDDGKAPFDQNCGQCHQRQLALETRLANKTFLDIGAGVWNHVTAMGPFPTMSEPDMRKILAYVWDLQVQGPAGNVTRGQLAFAAKGCVACHSNQETRAIVRPRRGKTFTAFSMASIAWGRNRAMHQEMLKQGQSWPNLKPEDVSDLVAYLNFLPKN